MELSPDISSVLPGMTLVLRIKRANHQPPSNASGQAASGRALPAAGQPPLGPTGGNSGGGGGGSGPLGLVSNAARELLQVGQGNVGPLKDTVHRVKSGTRRDTMA